MATETTMDLEIVKSVMKAAQRSDVWGTPEAGLFGNYPVPNRGCTPWSTTNAEYGRFSRRRGTAQNGSEAEAMNDVPTWEHGLWDSCGGGDATGQSGELNNNAGTQDTAMGGEGSQRGGSGGSQADSKLPPIDDGRYLIASRPMQSYPEMSDHVAATDARQDLQTGAGKRFMVKECNRFWDNMKSLNGGQEEGGTKYSWETDTQILKIQEGGAGNDDVYTGSDNVYTQNDDSYRQEDAPVW